MSGLIPEVQSQDQAEKEPSKCESALAESRSGRTHGLILNCRWGTLGKETLREDRAKSSPPCLDVRGFQSDSLGTFEGGN